MQGKMKFVQSPFNYTGGKYRLLSQIIPLFPKDIDVFVDLFCGGANVGVNATANQLIYNDINTDVIAILHLFKKQNSRILIQKIQEIIKEYSLSNTSENGYGFYNCESSYGVGEYNRKPFLKLRDDFNNLKERNDMYYLKLYVLIIYAFNNQIRFNQNHKFNLPVGKRDFNTKMKSKLVAFCEKLKNQNALFTNCDFCEFDINQFSSKSFIYADPPYLVACATYNEQKAWTEQNETELLHFLLSVDKKGIRFALSNILSKGDKENALLQRWIANNSKLKVHYLKYSYSNSNYQRKDNSDAVEVLITNY